MIRYVVSAWPPEYLGRRGAIGISTNLNYLKDPDDLLLSGINRIRVSISGMTQDIYSRNHIGGNIETVLRNIHKLVEIRKRHKIQDLAIGIGYHDLIYNKHEAEIAKKFCENNGLFFTLMRMYITSVEDNVIFHRDLERTTKHYEKFIDVNDETSRMRLTDKIEKCQFRRSVIVVNSDATVSRCCSVFESNNVLGSLFDLKIRRIPRIKSPICKVCASTPMSWR